MPKPNVVQAVAPVRVLPIDPPVKNGLVPAFRLAGVHVTPYGFLKSTAVEDSSNPHGDDFPLPGLHRGAHKQFWPNHGPSLSPQGAKQPFWRKLRIS